MESHRARLARSLRTPCQIVLAVLLTTLVPFAIYWILATNGLDISHYMYDVVVGSLVLTAYLIWLEGFAAIPIDNPVTAGKAAGDRAMAGSGAYPEPARQYAVDLSLPSGHGLIWPTREAGTIGNLLGAVVPTTNDDDGGMMARAVRGNRSGVRGHDRGAGGEAGCHHQGGHLVHVSSLDVRCVAYHCLPPL